MPDAIVIGAGPNGLTGANILADRGWDVLVLEAQPSPGGAVRSAELVEPGFVADCFSAFYPLGIASPHLRALDLHRHGLEWLQAPAVVAHPHSDGSCVALYRDAERSAASVASFAEEDREAWLRLSRAWEQVQPAFISSLMSPFPPIRPALRLLRALGGVKEVLDFARLGVMPLRRHVQEEFRGDGAARLLAGNALHADVTPDSAGSALFGWVLVGIGQTLGWPVARGGAGRITDALVSRLRAAGGELRCGEEVVEIVVRGDRAVGVRTAGGEEIAASRAVLADTGAPALYERMLPESHRIPLKRFQYDNSTFKVDWALDGPIPWRNEEAREAGTVHVTDGMDALSEHSSELLRGELPSKPFLLLGQYSHYDPSRAPAGKEAAWAYTHVAFGTWDDAHAEDLADRMEEQIEARAPGFRELIRGRHLLTPTGLEAANQNLVGGAVNGGTAQIHQQLVFRPTPGLGRAETPVPGLYLASASAHPGGGVHGACGANAAKAALSAPARRLVPRAIRSLG
ncbi:MAG TPA: NAD(P)/FAD-dependent oxidoreductase [Solirubrobacteraceae bacterium]|jgi:phytoene dehydrogenase-like protein